ncbi:hypothetical protein HDE_02824 [Halotydeus destructor]|nr:hypothetical protein HDE_02824 [Halotydeus destructor]
MSQDINAVTLNIGDSDGVEQWRPDSLSNLRRESNSHVIRNGASQSLVRDCILPQEEMSPPPYSSVPGTVPLHSGRTSGPPPSYDDVINPDAPPPSYHSLFGQVREARKNSSGLIDFLKKLVLILLGTLGVTILLSFTVIIPLTMIVVGALHMDQCPVENIPLFLLVGGLVWASKNLLNFYATCRRKSPDPAEEADIQARHRRRESMINCFLFLWFISGCVFVYRIYLPEFEDSTSPKYCNRTVYFYAFWLITATFIIFGFFVGCLCCLTVSAAVAANENPEPE